MTTAGQRQLLTWFQGKAASPRVDGAALLSQPTERPPIVSRGMTSQFSRTARSAETGAAHARIAF